MKKKKKKMKAHCNKCGGERNHIVSAEISKHYEDTEDHEYSVSGADRYFLIECQGCESVKLLQESWFSEDCELDGTPVVQSTYYPPSEYRKQPHWLIDLDQNLHVFRLLGEIYRALQNNAPSLAAMGIRAVIETIAIEKIGDQGSFASNLAKLCAGGFVTENQMKAVNTALEVGHASIHRMHTPKPPQLRIALDIAEHLVHGIYVLGPEAEIHAKDIPKRGNRSN